GKGCDKCGGTGKMYETSVEEIIGEHLVEMTSGEDFTLHGMGREDIDAKMLGDGRPFVMEIKEPVKRKIDLEELERRVNESENVQINSLEFTEKEKVVEVKQARAVKTYRVKVSLEETIEGAKLKKVKEKLVGQEISQRTPRRVDHRRSDKVRKRTIRDLEFVSMDNTSVTLDVTCDAGTYVKEFIHGDEDRTQPNLAELLETPCEVDRLDVMKIHYPKGE
ncbi:MAG: tRNA pseudouridine(54/55) synthase Pus10, partial [Candidatus Thermoplasmatota archaeon]